MRVLPVHNGLHRSLGAVSLRGSLHGECRRGPRDTQDRGMEEVEPGPALNVAAGSGAWVAQGSCPQTVGSGLQLGLQMRGLPGSRCWAPHGQGWFRALNPPWPVRAGCCRPCVSALH